MDSINGKFPHFLANKSAIPPSTTSVLLAAWQNRQLAILPTCYSYSYEYLRTSLNTVYRYGTVRR